MNANIFQTVPHDVLNYVIAPFLNASDRTAFNQVNHPFERVHKKFPADYAMKNHLNAMKNKYNLICRRHAERTEALIAAEERLLDASQESTLAYETVDLATAATAAAEQTAAYWAMMREEDAALTAAHEASQKAECARLVAKAAAAEVVRMYFKMYSLLEDPLFALAFKYDMRARKMVSQTLERFYEDLELLEQTSDDVKDNLRTRCTEVQAYITTIPFVREIGTK